MQYQPLNLGQGFTDYPVPQYITDALAATAKNVNPLLNQYTRGFVSVRTDFVDIDMHIDAWFIYSVTNSYMSNYRVIRG